MRAAVLLLGGLDGLAHAAGVLAIEGFPGAFDETILRRVVDEHVCPSHGLHHAPMTAAKMQAAKHGDKDAEGASHQRHG